MFWVHWRWICWCPHVPINVSIITAGKICYLWEALGWTLSAILRGISWIMYFLLLHFLLIISKFLAEHSTGQFKFLIPNVPYWVQVSWLPTVLNMLEDIPHQCPLIENCIRDALFRLSRQWSVIAVFIPLAAQRCVVQTRALFLCQAVVGVTQVSTTKVADNAGMNGQVGIPKGLNETMSFLSQN